jgi:hypothetical protein
MHFPLRLPTDHQNINRLSTTRNRSFLQSRPQSTNPSPQTPVDQFPVDQFPVLSPLPSPTRSRSDIAVDPKRPTPSLAHDQLRKMVPGFLPSHLPDPWSRLGRCLLAFRPLTLHPPSRRWVVPPSTVARSPKVAPGTRSGEPTGPIGDGVPVRCLLIGGGAERAVGAIDGNRHRNHLPPPQRQAWLNAA